MNARDLVPARDCAKSMGVKSVLYGGPGIGKTPLIDSAPNAVLCAIEPGMLSMANCSVLTYKAYEHPKGVAYGIDEFFKWFFESNESRKFDTLGVDSASEMAEAILRQELPQHKNKMAAYGQMSYRVMEILTKLYYLPRKHVVLISKQFVDKESGYRRPSYPGQDLNVKVPHFFDLIMHYSKLPIGTIPGVIQEVKALRCIESADTMARDRTGKLFEFEQPNLTQLFSKCMSN